MSSKQLSISSPHQNKASPLPPPRPPVQHFREPMGRGTQWPGLLHGEGSLAQGEVQLRTQEQQSSITLNPLPSGFILTIHKIRHNILPQNPWKTTQNWCQTQRPLPPWPLRELEKEVSHKMKSDSPKWHFYRSAQATDVSTVAEEFV